MFAGLRDRRQIQPRGGPVWLEASPTPRGVGRLDVPVNTSAPEIAPPGPTDPHEEDPDDGKPSTAISGTHDLTDEVARSGRGESAGLVRTARAIVRLARARRRLKHLPTFEQVRAMAWFDGREPCSYLLDRAVNFVPEPMEFGESQSSAGTDWRSRARTRTGGRWSW